MTTRAIAIAVLLFLPLPIVIVGVNACAGLCVSAVLKYCDSLVKGCADPSRSHDLWVAPHVL